MVIRIPGITPHPAKSGIARLRNIIAGSKQGDILHYTPDKLATVIERYDSMPVDPYFRHDIYNSINAAIELAEALVDTTYPAEEATQQVVNQMEVLGRILVHISQRPARTGFSILTPSTGALTGHFGTEEEASHHLESWQAIGMAKASMVIPVTVTSKHAVQPRKVPKQEPVLDENLPLPSGIVPDNPIPQPSILRSPTQPHPPFEFANEMHQPVDPPGVAFQPQAPSDPPDLTDVIQIPTPKPNRPLTVSERMAKLEMEARELARKKQ